MFDSHLEGSIRFRFSPPVDNVSHFRMSFDLRGDPSWITAPRLWGEYPLIGMRITDPEDEISEGDVDLTTGEVSNFTISVRGTHSRSRLFSTQGWLQ